MEATPPAQTLEKDAPLVVGVDTVNDRRDFIPMDDDQFEIAFNEIPKGEWTKKVFLNALMRTGRVMAACTAASVPRTTYIGWLKNDSFVRMRDVAQAYAAEVLIQEARRRAIDGTRRVRPIYHNGELVGEEEWVEYDSRLLQLMIKAEAGYGLPQRYNPAKVTETTGQITHLHQLAEAVNDSQEKFDKQLKAADAEPPDAVEGEFHEVPTVQPVKATDSGA